VRTARIPSAMPIYRNKKKEPWKTQIKRGIIRKRKQEDENDQGREEK